ncbi:YceH family protein [Sphingobacterium multivorum]|uniref:YceH family protein n=1 Tax=Sphingobacterium multivorum TaxID=28454 RepID=A0ABX7CVS5_SPHMU|nr:YceH family protein [Sphingobacterium multivorum]QQT29094.1 YceH family protein [Sphingobacterium multivorum]QQT54876.1 YceH family protein [Sphingobacterium multivorum]
METTNLPQLSAMEQRVLGALIEKSKVTPEYYPMTINSLQAACNQKTSRKPVVQYTEEDIIATLDILKKKGLISTVVGGGSRVTKYKHNFAIQFPLVPSELTIVCLLLLRGPLTAGEINSNSGRLYEFESLGEINEQLEKLAQEGYLKSLPKQMGHKEVRYIHLLGEINLEAYENSGPVSGSSNDQILLDRIAQLEQEVATLKQQFQDLWDELH